MYTTESACSWPIATDEFLSNILSHFQHKILFLFPKTFKTQVIKTQNKKVYSMIDKHQHMHFFTFRTVLV